MSWKNKSLRVFAFGIFAAPTTLFSGEPRIIVPSSQPPQVVFETDNSTYDVLTKFQNTRSSEHIHFQAIETLFPPKPERANVRRGYTMVKELVDAKKAAMESAARLDEERARLAAVRAELESQAQRAKWEPESDEFDYYEFDSSKVEPEPKSSLEPEPEPSLEPEPQPKPKPAARSTHRPHTHHHYHHRHQHAHGHRRHQPRTTPHVPVRRGGLLGRLFPN